MRGHLERAGAVRPAARRPEPAELAETLARHARWLDSTGREGERADFSDADLSYRDLAGAKLAAAILARANLEGARLCEANLAMGRLEMANLREADLTGADLRGANLERAHAQGARLAAANLAPLEKVGKGRMMFSSNLRQAKLADARSEERRVGKECEYQWTELP